MKKLRWIQGKTDLSQNAIIKRIKENPYTEKVGEGFVLQKTRSGEIHSTFIEKIEFSEIIKTPSNTTYTQKYLNYYTSNFIWLTEEHCIRLSMPGKRTSYFLNRLCEICNFNLSIDDIVLNPMLWLEDFEKSSNTLYSVNQIQMDGIALEPNLTGDIKLKGNEDIRNKINIFIKNAKYFPKKITAKAVIDKKPVSLGLYANGMVEFSDNFNNEVQAQLFNSLRHIAKWSIQ